MTLAPTIRARFCNEAGEPVSPLADMPADFLTRGILHLHQTQGADPTSFMFKVTEVKPSIAGNTSFYDICIKHYVKPGKSFVRRQLDQLNSDMGHAVLGLFGLIAASYVFYFIFGGLIARFAQDPAAYFGLWIWAYKQSFLIATSITVALLTIYFILSSKFFYAVLIFFGWYVSYLPAMWLFELLPQPDVAAPVDWPADFAQYGAAFVDTQATAVSALTVSMPALVALLNLLGASVLGKLVDIGFKASKARQDQRAEEQRAKTVGGSLSHGNRGSGQPGLAQHDSDKSPPPLLRLPLSPENGDF